MKKFIAVITVLSLFVLGASAQNFKSQNLLRTSSSNTAGTLAMPDNLTSNLASTVYNDAALWVNNDGSVANPRLLISLIGTNATATNTFTLTLQTVPDGTLVSTANNTTNRFTATLQATGTTRVTDSVLLPAEFVTGAKAIRLVTVGTDNKSTTGNITLTAKVTGYSP